MHVSRQRIAEAIADREDTPQDAAEDDLDE
jgi:hypothetical protein